MLALPFFFVLEKVEKDERGRNQIKKEQDIGEEFFYMFVLLLAKNEAGEGKREREIGQAKP